MPTLYNCHTDGDQYRITKFDEEGNVESSYLTTHDECDCPAGQRPTCRHRQMLPIFLAKDAVNSFYFYDWDRKGWVTNAPSEVTIVDLADTTDKLFNAIADAIGEPRLQAPGHTDLMVSPEAINEALQAQPVPEATEPAIDSSTYGRSPAMDAIPMLEEEQAETRKDIARATTSTPAEPATFHRRV